VQEASRPVGQRTVDRRALLEASDAEGVIE
jgi:hypothetical protein